MAECGVDNSPKTGETRREEYRMRGQGCVRVCKAGPGRGLGNRVGFKDLKSGTRAVKLAPVIPDTTVC